MAAFKKQRKQYRQPKVTDDDGPPQKRQRRGVSVFQRQLYKRKQWVEQYEAGKAQKRRDKRKVMRGYYRALRDLDREHKQIFGRSVTSKGRKKERKNGSMFDSITDTKEQKLKYTQRDVWNELKHGSYQQKYNQSDWSFMESADKQTNENKNGDLKSSNYRRYRNRAYVGTGQINFARKHRASNNDDERNDDDENDDNVKEEEVEEEHEEEEHEEEQAMEEQEDDNAEDGEEMDDNHNHNHHRKQEHSELTHHHKQQNQGKNKQGSLGGGKWLNSYEKASIAARKVLDEQEEMRRQREEQRKERQRAKRKFEREREQRKKILSMKNRRGQPNLDARMSLLLQQIEKKNVEKRQAKSSNDDAVSRSVVKEQNSAGNTQQPDSDSELEMNDFLED